MQETYRSIGRLAAFTVLSAPFLFSLLVWSIVGLVETVAEAMVVFAPGKPPNWCFLHQRVFPTGVCAGVGNPQSPPNTITLQPISHGQGRKNVNASRKDIDQAVVSYLNLPVRDPLRIVSVLQMAIKVDLLPSR